MRALEVATLALIAAAVAACSSGSGGAPGTPPPCGSRGCAPGYLCRSDGEAPSFCCGGTGASCAKDKDCCSGAGPQPAPNACTGGKCSSIANPCSSDRDCTGGAVCFASRCFKPPRATCGGGVECASGLCSGTCGLSQPYKGQGGGCRTVADCAHGACEIVVDLDVLGETTMGQCLKVSEGAACQSELDCNNGACTSGVCHCLHAGAVYLSDVQNPGCCSGYEVDSYCAASPGSNCATSADCFGGPCVSAEAGPARTCGCLGVGGVCATNADCCAGASRCMGGTCE